eukprot:440176-Pyramimonas_sp.AAC.1
MFLVHERGLVEHVLDELLFLEERVGHPWRFTIAPAGPAHGQFLALRGVARQASRAASVQDENEQFPGLV